MDSAMRGGQQYVLGLQTPVMPNAAAAMGSNAQHHLASRTAGGRDSHLTSGRPQDAAQQQQHSYGTPLGTLNTNSNVMTTGGRPAGDILDYLKGRGGRIKELEEQVAEHKAARDQLASELRRAQAHAATLQAQLQHRPSQQQQQQDGGSGAPAIYVADLEHLVKEHMASELELQNQVALAREQHATLRLQQAEVQAALKAAQQEAQRAAAEAAHSVRANQAQQAKRVDEAEARAARAELAAHTEASRAQAEAHMRAAAEAQLAEARRQLAAQQSLQQHASSSSSSSELALALAALRTAEARGAALTQQLDATQTQLAAVRSEAQSSSERAAAAEARVQRLEVEADALARQVATMQEKLGKGEFGAESNVRVLHLRLNPEAEHHKQAAQSQAGALEAMERRALAAEQQLQQAPSSTSGRGMAADGGGGGGGGGGGVAALMQRVSGLEAEAAVLRHRLSEGDKASQRLKEVFKERAAAFREAVYQLFGYRVDMASEATSASAAGSAPTTFSLRPQHADGPDAVLLFRYTSEGGMQLVPTPFTSGRLSREVDTFLRRFNCIPALTANLTMESFQKQTQC